MHAVTYTPNADKYLVKPSVQQPARFELKTEYPHRFERLAKQGLCEIRNDRVYFYSQFDLQQWQKR
jgi:hypothetical protein